LQKEEKLILGTCTTTYIIVINKSENADDEKSSDFRIILLAESEHYAEQEHLRASIQKIRKKQVTKSGK